MSAEKKVISPIPGIFYRRPSPDEEVYIQEGQSVNTGDTIGLIEVMKNFYEVKAEHNGILQNFFVENEQVINAGEELAVIITEE